MCVMCQLLFKLRRHEDMDDSAHYQVFPEFYGHLEILKNEFIKIIHRWLQIWPPKDLLISNKSL